LKDVFQNFKSFGRRKALFSAEGIGDWEKTEAFSDKRSGARGIFSKIPRVGVGRSPTAFFPSFYTKPEKISTVISRKWSFLSK
jgi:hypothetical protein